MYKKLVFLILIPFQGILYAQELNCVVTVNADLVNQTNQQIFKTLERSLSDYVNKTKWTNKNVLPYERIQCNLLFTIAAYEGTRFAGTLQVQSDRLVFNTSYQTPIFNYQDKQISFEYTEFQPLFYNPNTFDSNLVAVVTYYVYLVLGMDADTFALNGGSEYYDIAQNIVNLAQGSGYVGWQQANGNRTRWELTDNLRSNTFGEYRMALYQYHRLGMDRMTENEPGAKASIVQSLKQMERLASRRPNALLLQTFFDAKADEIKNLFSGGVKIDRASLVNTLNKISPFYANTWNDIKQ